MAYQTQVPVRNASVFKVGDAVMLTATCPPLMGTLFYDRDTKQLKPTVRYKHKSEDNKVFKICEVKIIPQAVARTSSSPTNNTELNPHDYMYRICLYKSGFQRIDVTKLQLIAGPNIPAGELAFGPGHPQAGQTVNAYPSGTLVVLVVAKTVNIPLLGGRKTLSAGQPLLIESASLSGNIGNNLAKPGITIENKYRCSLASYKPVDDCNWHPDNWVTASSLRRP